ncbi:MAG: aminotransferase class V-fold PLP-dependent enzyme [Planctomycetota bacterium]
MPSRREFLQALGPPLAVAAGARLRPTPASCEALEALHRRTGRAAAPTALAADEDFWAEVARAYAVDRSIVNLNNGGVSPAPAHVLAAQRRHLDFSNQAPAYTMWRVLEPQREAVRAQLADELGCDRSEVAITRNASEGLMICQFGLDLPAGAVVLATDHDYPRMLETFAQRQRREGLDYRELTLPVPWDNDATIIDFYRRALAEHRPALLLLSHVLYTTGQVLPVREIVALARQQEVPVIVDGAHAFAHVPFRIPDLDCDYYAAALHKWLSAPHGTGVLFVRRSRIRDLWPLQAANERLDDNIRKYEQIGTHPAAATLAVADALSFHRSLGAERKAARLAHLRELWQSRLVDRQPDRFVLHTSRAPGHSVAIATVQVRGVETDELRQWLFRRHRILTTVMRVGTVDGLRVSPSVYTTPGELDRFCRAMEHAAEHGVE